jgi:hypothetical protein
LSQPAQPKPYSDGAAPGDLAGILAPLDAESFLTSEYGEKFRFVPGVPDKFSALLPWSVLNSILETHRLEPPRLRLTREGKPVPQERYLSRQSNRRASGQPIPRLDATALTNELRDGATLVLDAVDELHRPIRTLAGSLERLFRVRVQVNAYAGWRTSHGFDLHWDDHDVFILQVAGRKQWKVYGMTRRYPLARDIEPAVDPPTEVLWEGLLQSGDLLYIPRGWWHVATPLDEPTLHLTVGVNNLTGADLLTWFIDRLRAVENLRRDIPHWTGAAAYPAIANSLRDVLFEHWRPGLIDEFLSDMDAKSRPRPSFALPWSATQEVLPADGWRVRWSGDRGAAVTPGDADDEIVVSANGRRWKFARASRPLLEILVSGRECDRTDLERASNGRIECGVIRAFVKELVINGLLIAI